jgi:polygalacturonase
MNGDAPLPTVRVVADIKRDFGAKGDNVTDDTDAFTRAFANTSVSLGFKIGVRIKG